MSVRQLLAATRSLTHSIAHSLIHWRYQWFAEQFPEQYFPSTKSESDIVIEKDVHAVVFCGQAYVDYWRSCVNFCTVAYSHTHCCTDMATRAGVCAPVRTAATAVFMLWFFCTKASLHFYTRFIWCVCVCVCVGVCMRWCDKPDREVRCTAAGATYCAPMRQGIYFTSCLALSSRRLTGRTT